MSATGAKKIAHTSGKSGGRGGQSETVRQRGAAGVASRITIHQPLSKDADDKEVDEDGQTPLHNATRAGLEWIVRDLLSDGSDVNAVDNRGRTPLHNAVACRDKEDIVHELLSRGADVMAVDKDGRTPLHDAACKGLGRVARILFTHGADTEAADKDGRTPLHDAARAGSHVVRDLLRKGADVEAVDKSGRTPLHDAARAGSKRIVGQLLSRGADVMAVDKDGRTPLLHGKVYVGWCPNPVVSICSQVPNTFASEVIKPSGVPAVMKLEEQSERILRRKISFSSQVGVLGSSLGFFSGAKIETGYRRVIVIAAQVREQNFERVLTSAMGMPTILWDSRNRKAWLLPLISVLAFASLRYIECQKYTFKIEQNGKFVKADVRYSTEMKNTGSEARTVLRQNSTLLVDTADGQPVNESLTFGDIVRDIWEGMCDGEDLRVDERSGLNFEDSQGIFGYDLSEAMYQKRVQLRKLQYLPTMKSWLPLCQGHSVQVIFSQYVGSVLSCRCEVVNGSTARQHHAESGILACLLDDLRSFYSPNWTMLAEDSCLNGLPIGEKFEWIPRGYVPGESHRCCSKSRLQSISEKPNQKLKRLTRSGNNPQERLMWPRVIQSTMDQSLVYFG